MTEVEQQGSMMNNQTYLSDSFTMMRIDTTKMLSELEAFYKGKRIVGWKETNDNILPVFESLGTPRMNDRGIQDIMSWLQSLFNPQTVQGNTDEWEHAEFIASLREDIACTLMTNMHDYEISENDYDSIIDRTIAAADIFFSRTKDNLERESYASTVKSVEHMKEKGGLSLPFGGAK